MSEMDSINIIKQSYQGVHDHMIPMMLKTESQKLRARLIPTINPIIWQAWHILRSEDMYYHTVMFNLPQVFHTGGWQKKLNLSTNHVGTGMTTEEADQLSQDIDLDQLKEYNLEMKTAVLALIDNPPIPVSNPLDSESEIDRRLKEADVFPEGVRQNRAKAYAPHGISSGIVGIISHFYMHIGQYFAVIKPL